MAEDSRDILMMLAMAAGTVPAECSAVVSPDDRLAGGFVGTQKVGNLIRGSYFAIEDFSFDIGITERTPADPAQATLDHVNAVAVQAGRAVGALAATQQAHAQRLAALEGSAAGRAPGAAPAIKPVGSKDAPSFGRFMSEGRAFLQRERKAYPSDLEPVAITKRMDLSSTTLLDCCLKSYKFPSASILKRKAVGTDTLRGYLRIDFTDVMLIDLSWDNDEPVKESFRFVCRAATVRYSVETHATGGGKRSSATLAPQPEVTWSVLNAK